MTSPISDIIIAEIMQEEIDKRKEKVYCIDCQHIATSINGAERYRCMAPQNFIGISLVDKSKQYGIIFCGAAREEYSIPFNQKSCGKEGKWFAPKLSKPTPDLLTSSQTNSPTGKSSTKLEELRRQAKLRNAKLTEDDLGNL